MIRYTQQKRYKRMKDEQELNVKDKTSKETAKLQSAAEAQEFFDSKNGHWIILK